MVSSSNLTEIVSEQVLQVLVNGEAREVPAGCTVDRLLDLLGVQRRRIAVSINRTIVPRSSFRSVALAADDRIEILEAVGGG
jgi:sulfur carrier protein